LNIDSSYKNKIWFYSWDYSDIVWSNSISDFLENFVPFFENFDNSMMEVRTKSSNIKQILDLWFVPKNTEFAFSLNPQELIDKYESWTSNLEERIKSINILLEKGYKVWLRFLPLLPVKNYEKIYSDFVEYIKNKIDITKISSTFVSWLLYTKRDYNTMLKKYPKLDVLYKLQEEKDWFIREDKKVRDFFYNLFKSLDEKCFICLDE
jgi:spore photoproduct lyase